MKLNIILIIFAFAAGAMASKLSAASKNLHLSNSPSTAKWAGLYKFLGGVKNTMIKNTNARKEKITMKHDQTISLRTKHVCNVCKFLVQRKDGAKRKRCAIYLKKNAHKCNPVKQSDFSSFV